ncbi:MAG: hypothetical protein EWM73_00442 [Nitrospira sp.]|nr:MAG: hypothetical protein EWM73_00442 [Nitrospira sp.]
MTMSRCYMLKLGILIVVTMLFPFGALAEESGEPQDIRRHCIGLLWCTERSGDATSVDGLLLLYSAEERGSYSRLAVRPLYSMEEDPAHNLLRRSILWPLGTYERRGDHTWAHVFPFYWHSEQPGREWTFTVPLYMKSIHGDSAWHHLFPLFSRHVMGEYYARNFVLGPILITTSDSRTDLSQWDLIFPLFHYRQDLNSSNGWLFPLYWSGEDRSKEEAYRYILPFYGSSDSASQHYNFLFPVYGYTDDTSAQVKRLAILGLPPAKGFSSISSLALFEHVTTADETSHRIFPLYRYVSGKDDSITFDALLLYRHQTAPSCTIDRFFPLYRYEGHADSQTHEFDLFGYRDASWFRYEDDPNHSAHRLLGLYNYDHSQDGLSQLSAVGYRRLSLYLHRSQDDLTEDRLVPLYDYFRQGNNSSLSLFGMSEIALYRQESSPSLFQHRLFPLYRYRHDLAKNETQFDAILLYRHLTTPIQVADRLLPFWDYAGATARTDWQFSLLGIETMALYRHDSNDAHTLDHLFPFYDYRSYRQDEKSQGSSFDMLGLGSASLVHHEETPTSMTNRVFPLYRYAHDEETGQTTINLLGVEPVSLFRSQSSPTQSAHHAFPLYSYRADDTTDTTSFSALWMFWRTTSPTSSQTSLFPIASLSNDEATGEGSWSMIGLDPALPISWIRHSWTQDSARGLFFPLYDYRREQDQITLSIGGLSYASLFRQEDSSTLHSHRLFPIYSYRHDLAQDVARTSILLAYEHESTPSRSTDTLIPFWRYERGHNQDEARFNVLGFGTWSLFEHHATSTGTTDRLFPLYKYESTRKTGSAEFSFIWPLVDYKSRQGTVTSVSLLWWLISYEHPDADHSDFHFLGASKMALVRRMTSPRESVFEFNPIIPLYRYRHETERGTSWDLFGGLVGMDRAKEQTRMKLFWLSL